MRPVAGGGKRGAGLPRKASPWKCTTANSGRRLTPVTWASAARALPDVPAWLEGPAPARLKGAASDAVLILADLMWRDSKTGAAGLRFEFQDGEERDHWTALLIDALLARYALA